MRMPTDRIVLRALFVLIGSALALAVGLIDITAIVLLHRAGVPTWLLVILGAVIVVAPLVAVGSLPALRTVEMVAATAMLDADLPASPGPAATAEQRRRSLGWFVLHVVTGAVVVVAMLAAIATARVLLVTALIVVVLVFAGLLGAGLARLAPRLLGPSYAERVALLERDIDRAVERNRLAREIHDSVGHALSLVTVQAGAARRVIHHDPAFAVDALAAIEDAARDATADLDRVLGLLREERDALRSPDVADLGELDALVRATRAAGLLVDHRVRGDLGDLPTVVSRESYRIAQEALTNALRYSADATVSLTLTRDREGLRIVARNPVDGAPPSTRSPGRAPRGLTGLRERVGDLGGTVEAGEGDGSWLLVARIPAGPADAGGAP